jgi:hypothetical protein
VGFLKATAGWVVVVTVAGLSSATTASAAAPATVAVTTKPVIALAANQGRVAFRTHFTDRSGGVCNSVHVLPLLGGRESVPVRCSRSGRNDHGQGVALGARTLVYDSVDVEPENATHDEAGTTLWRVGRRGRTRLAVESYEITCSGTGIGPFAYGAGTAFTRTVMTEVDPAMSCQLGSGGGPGVSRMTAASMRYVPAGSNTATTMTGAPGAARMAARWPTLALVPLKLPQAMRDRVTPPTQGTAVLQSWNLRTGTRRCTAGVAGPPTAVATNGAQIAAIVPTAPGHRLVRISAATCAQRGSRPLAGQIQPAVAIGAHVTSWVSGRSIMTLDLATGRVSRVYRAMLVPHGLVISDGRLVWWVNGRHGSRVLRLVLP